MIMLTELLNIVHETAYVTHVLVAKPCKERGSRAFNDTSYAFLVIRRENPGYRSCHICPSPKCRIMKCKKVFASSAESFFVISVIQAKNAASRGDTKMDRFCTRVNHYSRHIFGTLSLTNMGYTNLSIYTLRSFVVISSVSFGRSSSLVLDPIRDFTLKSRTKSE